MMCGWGVQRGERPLAMYLLAVLASISAKICLTKSSHLQAMAGARGTEAREEGSVPISASHLLCDFGQLTLPFWASVFLFIQ